MKKLVSLLLVLALVLGAFIPGFAATQEEAVAKLQEMNIVTGYADGSLGLDKNITRAEYAAVAVRMLGLEELAKMSNYPTTFGDVPVDQWYTGYVNVVAGKGIVNGYEDGTFRPQREVSFAEAVTMMVRLVGQKPVGNNWPENYLAKAAELGLLKDVAVANVQSPANRGTVFTVAYNALRVAEATKPVVTKAKGLVIENNRVERLGEGEVVIQVMEDFTFDKMPYSDGKTTTSIKAGAEFAYKVKKDEDVEHLLGKVVYLGFTGDKVTSIEVSKDYDYLTGRLSDVDEDELRVDGRRYTITKEEKTDDADRRFYQAYVNNKDNTLKNFAKTAKYTFAKVTVKNGKVLFVDAYEVEDIAPVAKGEDEDRVIVYDDQRDGREKKLGFDDAFVLEIKDKELYRSALKEIKTDDVVHYRGDDFVIVRKDTKVEGKYDKVRTERIDNERKTFIFVGENKYRAYVESYKTSNETPVYSYDGVKYRELTSSFDRELDKFEDRKVEVLLDMNGNVQLIRSDFKDPRFFALVNDILAKEVEFVNRESEKVEYELSFGSDLYIMNDLKDIKKLYEEDLNKINLGLKETDIEAFNRGDLAYVEVKDEKTIDSMVKIEFKASDFEKGALSKDYFRTDAGQKIFVEDMTTVFYKGKAYTVSNFLKKYKKDVEAAIVLAEGESALAAIVYVKSGTATAIDEDTATIMVKVNYIDARGGSRFLDVTAADGKSYYLEAGRDVAKMINDGDIEKNQILEVTYTEKEDKKIEDALAVKVLITANSEYRVYKVLDMAANGRDLTLGFNEDPDEDEDGFAKANRQNVYVRRNAAVFGDVAVESFIQIHVDKNNDVDAIKVVGEPKKLAVEPPVGVSKVALNEEITAVEKMDSTKYTAASWKIVADALTLAKNVAADKDATQAEVNDALEELQAAVKALVEYVPGTATADLKVGVLGFGPSNIFQVTVNSVKGVDVDKVSLGQGAKVAIGVEMTDTTTGDTIMVHFYKNDVKVGSIELSKEDVSKVYDIVLK